MDMKTIGVRLGQEGIDRIDALARRWSLKLKRTVTRSDVTRALLEEGFDRHEVTSDELDQVKRGMPKFRRPVAARPKLRLVDGDPEFVDPLVEHFERSRKTRADGENGLVSTPRPTHRNGRTHLRQLLSDTG